MLTWIASRILHLKRVIFICCLVTVVLSGNGPEDFEGCMESGGSLEIPMRCVNEIIEIMYAHFRRVLIDRQERDNAGKCTYLPPEPSDCFDLESTQDMAIDEMRKACNTMDHCLYTLPYHYIAQCNDSYDLIVHVQVKHACWPKYGVNGTRVVPRYPMDEPIQRGDPVSRIMLQSWNYPHEYSSLEETVCHISIEEDYALKIYVLDLTNVFEFQIDPICPYRLIFEKVDDFCATRGTYFVTRSVWYPEKKLIEMKFTRSVTAWSALKARFWLLFVATDKHKGDYGPGLRITCSGDRVSHPPPAPVTSATTTLLPHQQDYVITLIAMLILLAHTQAVS